jgi:hypothetical protein
VQLEARHSVADEQGETDYDQRVPGKPEAVGDARERRFGVVEAKRPDRVAQRPACEAGGDQDPGRAPAPLVESAAEADRGCTPEHEIVVPGVEGVIGAAEIEHLVDAPGRDGGHEHDPAGEHGPRHR